MRDAFGTAILMQKDVVGVIHSYCRPTVQKSDVGVLINMLPIETIALFLQVGCDLPSNVLNAQWYFGVCRERTPQAMMELFLKISIICDHDRLLQRYDGRTDVRTDDLPQQ